MKTKLHYIRLGILASILFLIGCDGSARSETNLADTLTKYLEEKGYSIVDVRTLIDSYPGAVNFVNSNGDTAINVISRSNNSPEMYQLILESGANPNHISPAYGPPISHAAFWREPEVIELLLKHGADPNLQSITGLHVDGTALHTAARDGNDEIVQILIDHGADVNARIFRISQGQPDNSAPLHYAANIQDNILEYNKGYYRVVETLVKKGADVNAQDGSGNTPLDLVMNRRNADERMRDLLLAHDAKQNTSAVQHNLDRQPTQSEAPGNSQ